MLKDKVILITGSSRGIGAAAAKLLARYGATIVINYNKNAEKAKSVLKEIQKISPSSIAIKADVSKKSEVQKMLNRILKDFKKIDAVVNNASAPVKYKSFSDITWKDFQKHLDVCLYGPFNIIKDILPYMMQNKKGKIINILSSCTMSSPPSKLIDYVSSKYALLGFSKSLAVELGPYGITVNCISPGVTETDMASYLPQKLQEIIAYQTPLKRLAQPIDVASVIAFLCSDASDYITGANIPVCGGNVMS